MTVLRPARDVWVLTGPRHRWTGLRPTPDDARSVAGLPPWRAAERLAGRAALRELLLLAQPDLAVSEVVPDRRGKPWLADHPRVGISVSHDGGTIAAAVALDGPVGVDVQHAPHTPYESMLRRCLGRHAQALDRLRSDQQAQELAWVWSVQEACVKVTGSGLSGRPWSIDVPPGRAKGRWRSYRWVSFRGQSAVPLSCAFLDPAASDRPPAVSAHVPKG
jgi:4'-phosphopantetheinyl transferase